MTSSEDDRGPSYPIGYKRPPAQYRFRKGQSGNPKGKSPGRKNLKTELLEELASRVVVTEGGRQRQLSKQSVVVKRLVSDAAKGDAKARDQLIRLIGEIERAQPQTSAANEIGAAKDVQILERFKHDLIKNIGVSR
ncbi:hypothetical protein BH10PSE7_BH10PSE7_31420 [soil metagenome]